MIIRAENERCGSLRRVLWMVDERGENAGAGAAAAIAEADVGTSRFFRSDSDCRCRAGRCWFATPPRSKARKYSPGWKISNAAGGHELRQRAFRDLLGSRRRAGRRILRLSVAVYDSPRNAFFCDVSPFA